MKEIIITTLATITFIILWIVGIWLIFNAISVFVCLASEGNVTWNKAVFACHFEDSPIINTQIVQSSYSQECYKNGIRFNCSDLQ